MSWVSPAKIAIHISWQAIFVIRQWSQGRKATLLFQLHEVGGIGRCICQQGASGCYIHPHVLDWKRQQSKKMLNNAENWIGILVLRVHPCACVVKCMDVHGGRLSTVNRADVELNFLLGSHHSRDIKPINHRKSRTETHNKVTIMKRLAKKLMITLIFHHGLAQRHSFSRLRFSILFLYRCNHQLTYNTLLSTY